MTNRIARVHVANFGVQNVYYRAETLDFRSPRTNQPDHALISMPNGTGKTSLESAISWVFAPKMRRFIATLQEPNRPPHEYFNERPSYTVVEVQMPDGRSRLFGYVAVVNERREGNAAIDRWFFTLSDPRVPLEHFPAPGLKFEASENSSGRWRQELSDLRTHLGQGLEVTQSPSEWLDILKNHGMDSELFDLQAEFARSEGGVDKLLTFRSEREAVAKILEMTLPTDKKDAVQAEAEEVIRSIRELPGEKAKLEAMVEMHAHLGAFATKAEAFTGLRDAVSGHVREMRSLARAMSDRVEAARLEKASDDQELDAAKTLHAAKDRQKSGLEEQRARLRATAAHIALRDARARETAGRSDLDAAKTAETALRAARDQREILREDEQIAPLRATLRERNAALDPMRAEVARLGRGARLRLEARLADRESEMKDLEATRDGCEAGIEALRGEVAGHEKALGTLSGRERENDREIGAARAGLEQGLRDAGFDEAEIGKLLDDTAGLSGRIAGMISDIDGRIVPARSDLDAATQARDRAANARLEIETRIEACETALSERRTEAATSRAYLDSTRRSLETLDTDPLWASVVDEIPSRVAERGSFLDEEASKARRDARRVSAEIEQIETDIESIERHGVAGIDRELVRCLRLLDEDGIENVQAFPSWAAAHLGESEARVALEHNPALSRGIVVFKRGAAIAAIEEFVRSHDLSVPIVILADSGAYSVERAELEGLSVVVPDKAEIYSTRKAAALAGEQGETIENRRVSHRAFETKAHRLSDLSGGYAAFLRQHGEDGVDRAETSADTDRRKSEDAEAALAAAHEEMEGARRTADDKEAARTAAAEKVEEMEVRRTTLGALRDPGATAYAAAMENAASLAGERERVEAAKGTAEEKIATRVAGRDAAKDALPERRQAISGMRENIRDILHDDEGDTVAGIAEDAAAAFEAYRGQAATLHRAENENEQTLRARIDERESKVSGLRARFDETYLGLAREDWQPLLDCADFDEERKRRKADLGAAEERLEKARVEAGQAEQEVGRHEGDALDDRMNEDVSVIRSEIDTAGGEIETLAGEMKAAEELAGEIRARIAAADKTIETGGTLLRERAGDIGSLDGILPSETEQGDAVLRQSIVMHLDAVRSKTDERDAAREDLDDTWAGIRRLVESRGEVFAPMQAQLVGIEHAENFADSAPVARRRIEDWIDIARTSIASKEPTRRNFECQLEDLLGLAIDRFDELVDESRKAAPDGQSYFRVAGMSTRLRKSLDKFISPEDRGIAVKNLFDFLAGQEKGMPTTAEMATRLFLEATRQASIRNGRSVASTPEQFELGLQFRKPGTQRAEWVPIHRPNTSGGEGVTIAILLYMILARLRREGDVGVLMLENPIGKANRSDFVASWFALANVVGAQLVIYSGIKDQGAVSEFETIIRGERVSVSGRTHVRLGRVHAGRTSEAI